MEIVLSFNVACVFAFCSQCVRYSVFYMFVDTVVILQLSYRTDRNIFWEQFFLAEPRRRDIFGKVRTGRRSGWMNGSVRLQQNVFFLESMTTKLPEL